MGLFDFLFGKSKCPQCGAKGARTSGGRLRCPNPSCPNFDAALAASAASARGSGRSARAASSARRSRFSPAQTLSIRYRNFQGQDKTFVADADSLRRKHNHLTAQVAPTGQRISFSRDRVQNLEELDAVLSTSESAKKSATGPTARERQVLAYHKKYKSTSPLFEQIRAKYPNW
jgi:hypothetical protein